MAASFLSAMLLARALGPEQYGLYSLGLTLATLFSAGALLGLPTLTSRETGSALSLGHVDGIKKYWTWAVRLLLGTSVLATVAFLGFVFWSTGRESPRFTILMASALLVPLLAAAAWMSSALLGLNRVILSVLVDQILRPFFLALGILGLLMAGGLPNALTAILILSCAAALSVLAGILILMRGRPQGGITSKPDSSAWWKALWPLSLVAGVQMVNQNIDTLFLAAWHSDRDVGFYRIALSVAQMAMFGVTVGNMMVQAQASGLYANGSVEAVQHLLKTASRIGFSLVALAALPLIPFGGRILSIIFGSDYAEAAIPLAILLAGTLIMSFVGAAGMALAMLGGERRLLEGALLGVAWKILLCLILAPRYGVTGVALASAVSTAVTAAYWAWALRRYFSFRAAAF